MTRKNFGKALEGMQAALESESKSKVRIFRLKNEEWSNKYGNFKISSIFYSKLAFQYKTILKGIPHKVYHCGHVQPNKLPENVLNKMCTQRINKR